MWPFKPKPPEPPSWEEIAVAELRGWRKIGESFQYLGRECVVTGYFGYSFDSFDGCDMYIKLSADYVDEIGVIRSAYFHWQEAQALMASNP